MTSTVRTYRDARVRAGGALAQRAGAGGGIEPHTKLGEDVFHIFGEHQPAVALLDHQRSARSRSVTTGKGSSATSGSWCAISASGARHMIVRGDHDQRTETAAFGPALGLDRISERIERAVEIDAATHQRSNSGVEARDFVGVGRPVGAADQQAPAAPGPTARSHRRCARRRR